MSMTAGTQLGTSASAIFTATGENAILSIIFCNTTTAQKKVTLYRYPSGGSASDSTTLAIVYINGENSFTWSGDEKLLLDNGDVLAAKADAATSVSAQVCYKVIG